jgi:hypothetical protein
MKLRDHVLCAIDDAQQGKQDAALLHACMSIDGTAKRLYPNEGVKARYVRCLRTHYWILEVMIGSGFNLAESRFANIRLPKLHNPDFAEIVYHILRCSHAHADEVPNEFTLTASEGGFNSHWLLRHNEVHMPDRVIWALLAVSVFSKINVSEFTAGTYYLSLGNERFTISDWWGREDDFRAVAERYNHVRVRLEGLDRLIAPTPGTEGATEYLVIKQPPI